MQTQDVVEGLHDFRELSQPSEWGYVNTEKELKYFYKVILKNTRKSETP